MSHATVWRDRLRVALLAARKDRDAVRVSALRSALSAIDNAEAVDSVQGVRSDSVIAGAAVGLGSAEVARRDLSDAQIGELIHREIDERLTAAEQFTAGGHTERADTLRTEAAVLTELLGDV